ncbi:lipoprotein signal peptidase [Microscilla marina]|uniref:Lipoprotein signal peptidase n=1 Tax=Microscilla marina ATCC 23134 TaxID=313606 RepID=A1ZGC7_MICM2|nr:lipoprotein signal peptidase [Microscilla marina]EAY30544.1 signal peptidase II [Microscilla marina ATCC 23134]
MKKTHKLYKYFLLSFVVILLDQAVKLLVHYNMDPGLAGEIKVLGSWLKIHYVLNPGMAFGLKLGSVYGKLILTLFRLLATVGIAYYMSLLVKRKAHTGLVWCVALILAGAVGNVVDSTFYGVFLNNAPAGSPTPWFHGQVIDMIYLDIWEGHLPQWLGGQYYALWPIFNIADSAIFLGVAVILVMQRRFFKDAEDKKQDNETNKDTTTPSTGTTAN